MQLFVIVAKDTFNGRALYLFWEPKYYQKVQFIFAKGHVFYSSSRITPCGSELDKLQDDRSIPLATSFNNNLVIISPFRQPRAQGTDAFTRGWRKGWGIHHFPQEPLSKW